MEAFRGTKHGTEDDGDVEDAMSELISKCPNTFTEPADETSAWKAALFTAERGVVILCNHWNLDYNLPPTRRPLVQSSTLQHEDS